MKEDVVEEMKKVRGKGGEVWERVGRDGASREGVFLVGEHVFPDEDLDARAHEPNRLTARLKVHAKNK